MKVTIVETDWADVGEWTWHVVAQDVFDHAMTNGGEPMFLRKMWINEFEALAKFTAPEATEDDVRKWCKDNGHEIVDLFETSADTSEF